MAMALNLKAARFNAELTLTQVSEKTGIHENTLSSYEAYRTKPSIDKAIKIAEAYGCRLDDIKWSAEE